MKKDTPDGTVFRVSRPGTLASDLRGKQSVRATFKLSEQAIGALNVVSVHLGIKQKSLFDHLMEDIEALQAIARNIRSEGFQRSESVQKTYVLSRRTLSSLEAASKSFNAPRDALVEISIQRLLPIIVKEKEKHLKRKEVLADMAEYLENGLKLLEKTRERLGGDDPVYERMESAVSAAASAYEHVESFVQKGKVIERF